jgi:polar amino acid transport system substrate-binding protein
LKKKLLVFILLSATLVSLFAGGFPALAQTAESEPLRDYTWFEGKKVGIDVGSAAIPTLEAMDIEMLSYPNAEAGIQDVLSGRISAYCNDLSALRLQAAEVGDGSLECIEIPMSVFMGSIGAISSFENRALVDEFNSFLALISADGTKDDMISRWFDGVPDLDAPMPELTYTGQRGKLTVAATGAYVPFDYTGEGGILKGYSIELMNRFASWAGFELEYITMEFGGLLAAVSGGRADLGISNLTITEERAKSVLFTDSIYDDQLAFITLRENLNAPTFDDFIGKRIAVLTGSIYDEMAQNLMQAKELLYFDDFPSMIESVKNGRADAVLYSYFSAYIGLMEEEYSSLAMLEVPEDVAANPLGAMSMDQAIIDQFNEFLALIKADGTYDEMSDRWLESFDPANVPSMPDIPLTGENGTLSVATSLGSMPFTFLGEGGSMTGYDMELARRFAAYCGKDIELVDMTFSGLLPYIASRKADLAIAEITITEERAKSVLFSEPYYNEPHAIAYLKTGVTSGESFNLITWLKDAVEKNLITENRWLIFVNGMKITLEIAFLSQFFGTILGCFLCWVLLRKTRLVRGLGTFYSGLIRGLPIVVLLMISYHIVFRESEASAVIIAVSAFSLVKAVDIALSLKGGIDTVDTTEIEAARSIGFSAFGAFKTVTLPQAVKFALPGYFNGFVELVKATAVVGYITIQDLTRAADIVRSRTYDPFFTLLFIALIYLLSTTILVQFFKFLIRRFGPEAHK